MVLSSHRLQEAAPTHQSTDPVQTLTKSNRRLWHFGPLRKNLESSPAPAVGQVVQPIQEANRMPTSSSMEEEYPEHTLKKALSNNKSRTAEVQRADGGRQGELARASTVERLYEGIMNST